MKYRKDSRWKNRMFVRETAYKTCCLSVTLTKSLASRGFLHFLTVRTGSQSEMHVGARQVI